MARSGTLTTKDEFRNTTEGWIGVVTVDARGDHHGMPVAPGDTVWLSEEEQILTANAPRSDDDNPFSNGTLKLVTRQREVRNRRPYGEHAAPVAEPDPEPESQPAAEPETETGAGEPPAGEPEEGVQAPAEEVGTPKATAAAGKRRRTRAAA